MKKNIIILILLAIIFVLIVFVLSNKRIIISNQSDEVNTTKKQIEYIVTEEITEASSVDITTELTTEFSPIIVIDPGHQSKGNSEMEPIAPGATEKKAKVSSGTSGVVTGIPEYLVNLQVALKLKTELDSRGYTVIMTRETNDVNISNSERANIANNAGADAFVRIHCNGDSNQNTNGTLTMCQSPNNIYCGQLYKESRCLSDNILIELCNVTNSKNRGVIETDTMSGINWCQVPVTIVEMGFMTNPEEDRLLNDDIYQNKSAVGIANGIDSYFNS